MFFLGLCSFGSFSLSQWGCIGQVCFTGRDLDRVLAAVSLKTSPYLAELCPIFVTNGSQRLLLPKRLPDWRGVFKEKMLLQQSHIGMKTCWDHSDKDLNFFWEIIFVPFAAAVRLSVRAALAADSFRQSCLSQARLTAEVISFPSHIMNLFPGGSSPSASGADVWVLCPAVIQVYHWTAAFLSLGVSRCSITLCVSSCLLTQLYLQEPSVNSRLLLLFGDFLLPFCRYEYLPGFTELADPTCPLLSRLTSNLKCRSKQVPTSEGCDIPFLGCSWASVFSASEEMTQSINLCCSLCFGK